MSHGIAISTYLMDGSLTGPRYMKIEGGRLRLFVLPRDITTKLSVKEYPEYDTPCVYVLTGEDNGKKAYVGQSNAFKNRAVNHKTNKEFWDTAYVIVAEANTGFDANAINYLESKSIEDAKCVGNNIATDNKINPKFNNLQKHQLAPLEVYYEEAKMLLEFAGCGVFVKLETKEEHTHTIKAPKKGIEARAIYDAENHTMIVLAGSVIDPDYAPSLGNKEKRKKLIAEYTERDAKGKLVTIKNLPPLAPSTAACFILGRPANGLNEWKDKDGKCLNDLK